MKKGLSVLIISIFLISITLVLALPYPHALKGYVNISDGKSPVGQMLKGEINGVTTGSCIIESGGSYELTVTKEAPYSGTIKFYIGNDTAHETASFTVFEISILNLTFDTISNYTRICGNNFCDSGECGTCTIDCKVANCLGNGACDTQMGETCSTVSQDCGACPVTTTTTTTSNSPGGGGGPPRAGNTIATPPANTNETTDGTTPLSLDQINQERENPGSTSKGVTGAVIGFVGTPLGIVSVIFILLIIVLAIIVVIKKRRK